MINTLRNRFFDEGEIDVLPRFRLNTDLTPKPAALRYIVQVLLLIVAQLAYGADYVREKKWADEITPGIVVGDPVYLEGRAGHRFLTIYTEAHNAKAGLVIVHDDPDQDAVERYVSQSGS